VLILKGSFVFGGSGSGGVLAMTPRFLSRFHGGGEKLESVSPSS